ncbi:MAG: hypothetical protein GWO28_10500 [candidate division Zixibacteria bacterium]|nr:hypothetical protein [candidate division Zixibacteria bacterium]
MADYRFVDYAVGLNDRGQWCRFRDYPDNPTVDAVDSNYHRLLQNSRLIATCEAVTCWVIRGVILTQK